MGISRTKVTDILDAHKISYKIIPHVEPVFTVEAVAEQRDVVKEDIVKSILLRDKNDRYVMACVPGNARLDPKAVRMYLPKEWKRLYFATAEEILAVIGQIKGAVTPVGLPNDVPVIIDASIACRKKVNISSGDPTAGLELDPKDLVKAATAQLAPIAEVK